MGTIRTFALCALIVPVCGMGDLPQESGGQGTAVYVIPIHGEIDTAQTAFVVRSVDEALKAKPDLVILDVDTPGGSVEEMLRIVSALGRIKDAGIRMATYIGPSNLQGAAFSAGVVISLASPGPLYMHPQSVIGAAVVLPEGEDAAGEKFNSAVRAKFAAVARDNGYDPDLIVAMVDIRKKIYRVKVDGKDDIMEAEEIERLERDAEQEIEVIGPPLVDETEVLTLDAEKAEELGLARVVPDRSSVYAQLGLQDVTETVAQKSSGSATSVQVIPIYGEINTTQTAFVLRAVGVALESKPDLVLLDVDTPGGSVEEMLRIVSALGRIKDAGIRMATYIGPSNLQGAAYSAGVVISLTSPSPLYMHPQSAIGAAVVIMVGPEGVEAAGEKFTSAMRAKFAAVAKDNGYDPDLIVAMVDIRKKIYRVKVDGQDDVMEAAEIEQLERDAEHEIEVFEPPLADEREVLTLDARQAEELGMARIVKDRSGVYTLLGLENVTETVMQRTWSEDLVGVVTSGWVRIVLLILGIMGIWIEMKTPGFGAPGVVGVAAFTVFIFGHYVAGLAEFPEIILIVVGVAFLAVEIFLFPGTLVSGILGVVCIFAGIILAMQSFVLPDFSEAPWEVETFRTAILQMLLSFAGAGAGIVMLAPLLPKIPMLGRVVLKTDLDAAKGFEAPGVSDLEGTLKGRHGIAITSLRPGGKIEINGDLYDVVTDGEFLEKGEQVIVQSVESNHICVQRYRGGAAS